MPNQLFAFDGKTTDISELTRMAQEGSDEAAEALFARCREPLLEVLRKVIFPPIRTLFDSDDFLLVALQEVFTRHFADEVLRSPEALWPYLRRIAKNKVRDAERKWLIAKKYDIRRNVSLATLLEEDEPISKEMSSEEIVMLKELLEERLVYLIMQLPSMLRRIVRMLLDGDQGINIARRLGVEAKQVYRAMDWLRRKVIES